jgi:hypothetical protein
MEIQKQCTTIVPVTYQEESQYYHALKPQEMTYTIPYRSKLISGTSVILMKNINIDMFLINGACDTISEFMINDETGKILTIMALIDHMPNTQIPVSRTVVNKYHAFNSKTSKVFQFPLRLAWVVTTHTS